MKNYIQPGANLTLAAPYARKSGEAAQIGAIFGVASNDVAAGDETVFVTEGCFELPKAAGNVGQGARLYWDDAAKVLTATAAGNMLVGAAIAASAGATVQCKLGAPAAAA
jgi:predicted RecA/RadA family phage recombinase